MSVIDRGNEPLIVTWLTSTVRQQTHIRSTGERLRCLECVYVVGVEGSEDDASWTAECEIPWSLAPEGRVDGELRTIGLSAGRFVKASSMQYGFPAIPFPSPTYVQDFAKIVLPRCAVAELNVVPYPLVHGDRDVLQRQAAILH